MAIKILIGGSPCTHWSIAQKNNREVTAEGVGWELFKNYLIAKEKFQPDFFLYENNKSASQAIKDQIAYELGVGSDPMARFTYINSALVSAQNRQRFYVTNFGDITQPADRGVLLQDILETGSKALNDKSYALTTRCQGAIPSDTFERHRHTMVAQPVGTTKDGKSFAVTAYYSTGQNAPHTLEKHKGSMVAEPILLEDLGNSKTIEKSLSALTEKYGYVPEKFNAYNLAEITDKSPTLSTGSMVTSSCATTILEPVENSVAHAPIYVGEVPGHHGKYRNGKQASQQYRVFSVEGKSVCCDSDSRKHIAQPVIFQVPHGFNEGGIKYEKAPTLTANGDWAHNNFVVERWDGKTYPIYEVKNNTIRIKDKEYPVKLSDGFYIIRKLTVTECCRLQTMPDDYCKAVSATQAYKGLGNGWTAEVIIHLLNHALQDVPRDEEIVVLSMYDGIGTGRYCLDKMGFSNVKYHAYEIDKHPMAIANDNFPDIIQHGDAFAVRDENWKPPQTRSEWLDSLLGGGVNADKTRHI